MALKDRPRPRFTALGGRNIGDDIIDIILNDIGNAQFMETAYNIIADGFFMVRRTRMLGQAFKFRNNPFNNFIIMHSITLPSKWFATCIIAFYYTTAALFKLQFHHVHHQLQKSNYAS
ncbi:hypothetical protein HMPREF3201_00748 [Megasphaera sp. MJR8396C]|nr:hypothetical protein HMPREF3201_00748 [Megasphaera sp. MJR8396C]